MILEMLNHGVGRLGESVGRFHRVSGLTFRVDAPGSAGTPREESCGGLEDT